MPEFLNSELITMIFDMVLIAAVIGLWGLWWQQTKQRKKIEKTLVEASTQLQEATMMLNQALVQIQSLQDDTGSNEGYSQAESSENNDDAMEEMKQKIEARTATDLENQSESTANVSQVAQMLCLQREGVSPEKIAEKLNMPLAQVKLMLMLQSSPKIEQ